MLLPIVVCHGVRFCHEERTPELIQVLWISPLRLFLRSLGRTVVVHDGVEPPLERLRKADLACDSPPPRIEIFLVPTYVDALDGDPLTEEIRD